jgi:hypothetical protein
MTMIAITIADAAPQHPPTPPAPPTAAAPATGAVRLGDPTRPDPGRAWGFVALCVVALVAAPYVSTLLGHLRWR